MKGWDGEHHKVKKTSDKLGQHSCNLYDKELIGIW